MDALTLRDRAEAALTGIPASVTTSEPRIGADGRVERTVIVTVTTGTASNRRAAGGSVNRNRYVNVLVVTASRDSCIWLTDHVRDALTDLPLGHPHGRLADASYDGEPVQELDTAPARWSRALTFQTTTKRST